MMNPLDDFDASPTHTDCDALAPALATTSNSNSNTTQEREMIFYRRPDITGRQLLFQPRRASVVAAKPDALAAPPVQLVALDGQTYFGIPAADTVGASHVRSQSTGGSSSDPGRNGSAMSSSDGLGRLLVTTNPVFDAQGKRRIRQLQLAMLAAGAASVILTAALLYPDGRGAWYNVDAYASAFGPLNAERVRVLRPRLLALAVLVNGFGVTAAFVQHETLVTLYIFALVCSDILSLMQLLPHMFFLLRFLFDLLLVLLAVEMRANLEHAWFVTNFLRRRY